MATEENAIQAVALVGFADRGGVQGEVRWPLKVKAPSEESIPLINPGRLTGSGLFNK